VYRQIGSACAVQLAGHTSIPPEGRQLPFPFEKTQNSPEPNLVIPNTSKVFGDKLLGCRVVQPRRLFLLSEKVEQHGLEGPLEPYIHGDGEALLALGKMGTRYPWRNCAPEEGLFLDAVDLEWRRHSGEQFDKLVIQEGYADLQGVGHADPVGQGEEIIRQVDIQIGK
jgi:hypothetical protein